MAGCIESVKSREQNEMEHRLEDSLSELNQAFWKSPAFEPSHLTGQLLVITNRTFAAPCITMHHHCQISYEHPKLH